MNKMLASIPEKPVTVKEQLFALYFCMHFFFHTDLKPPRELSELLLETKKYVLMISAVL